MPLQPMPLTLDSNALLIIEVAVCWAIALVSFVFERYVCLQNVSIPGGGSKQNPTFSYLCTSHE